MGSPPPQPSSQAAPPQTPASRRARGDRPGSDGPPSSWNPRRRRTLGWGLRSCQRHHRPTGPRLGSVGAAAGGLFFLPSPRRPHTPRDDVPDRPRRDCHGKAAASLLREG